MTKIPLHHEQSLTYRLNLALVNLDLAYVRTYCEIPQGKDNYFVLVVAHKARGIPLALRLDSVAWLKKRGHDRMYGLPWDPL